MNIGKLFYEDVAVHEDCVWCKEVVLDIGDVSEYGAVVIARVGEENGWFATLSPKNDGSEGNFTIQIMPFKHLTHFGQVVFHEKMAENYGRMFASVSTAMTTIMAEENKQFNVSVSSREVSTSVATYGKCTNWSEKKEHLHIKVFPFHGGFGQPTAVDSSFGRKQVYNDEKGEFVKMVPVRKKRIPAERFDRLKTRLISLLSKESLKNTH